MRWVEVRAHHFIRVSSPKATYLRIHDPILDNLIDYGTLAMHGCQCWCQEGYNASTVDTKKPAIATADTTLQASIVLSVAETEENAPTETENDEPRTKKARTIGDEEQDTPVPGTGTEEEQPRTEDTARRILCC
jgi:hypothetical protein